MQIDEVQAGGVSKPRDYPDYWLNQKPAVRLIRERIEGLLPLMVDGAHCQDWSWGRDKEGHLTIAGWKQAYHDISRVLGYHKTRVRDLEAMKAEVARIIDSL